jgi:hypothetical protein
MDRTILFKVNSETSIKDLVELNNTVVKRIRALEAHRILPKAEVIDGRTSEEGISNTTESASDECLGVPAETDNGNGTGKS